MYYLTLYFNIYRILQVGHVNLDDTSDFTTVGSDVATGAFITEGILNQILLQICPSHMKKGAVLGGLIETQ